MMGKPCSFLLAAAVAASCTVSEDGPDAGTELDDETAEVDQTLTGTFRLEAVHSGKCVDVAAASTANGGNVHQWSCHDNANQRWQLVEVGGGQHELVSVHSGKCLDVAGASTANGGNVQQWSCAGVAQQRWTLEPQAGGAYRLRSVHSGKCLDVAGVSTANGANVQQWSCGSGANQRFVLEPVSGGTGPLGSGWVEYEPTKKIHLDDESGLRTFSWTASKSVCSPTCADYRYDSATDTETFRILDNRSNRSEIRLQNEYSTGRRQFQGYVRFDAPLDDESLFQIFGSTSGATQLMIRGYSGQNGSLRGGGQTLATSVYGVEKRVNVIHRQGQDIRIYINGSLAHTIVDDEAVTNYHKYGCYGTLHTPAVTVRWRGARSYRDGQPP